VKTARGKGNGYGKWGCAQANGIRRPLGGKKIMNIVKCIVENVFFSQNNSLRRYDSKAKKAR
jgi:hypothetical protein